MLLVKGLQGLSNNPKHFAWETTSKELVIKKNLVQSKLVSAKTAESVIISG